MRNNRVMRQSGRALALGAVALGIIGAMAQPAAAEESLPREEIIADCDSGLGKCTFNDPVLDAAYLGDFKQVSDSLHNCTTSPATQSMTWTDTVGSTDEAGVSVSVGGSIKGIIDLSVTASYKHTWTDTHAESSALNMTVQPGEVGWVSRAQVMQKVSGTWQTHYDNQKLGHYFWFAPDTITGPAANGTEGKNNAVVMKTRKLTPEELQSCTAQSAGAVVVPN
ncbi:hypothetical protein [Streptomyces sp. H27-D2]|uniref:hypothetical protein n=1 Tax=Streptomyces sp. H27-D2 TaxID=3046304 RepID=UPI002DBA7764|nr:hypothetical protein [Streptomyces sp. H27-D2]MEC4018095.1 hypothetical protein [Streptomyces sp. H27-D2]